MLPSLVAARLHNEVGGRSLAPTGVLLRLISNLPCVLDPMEVTTQRTYGMMGSEQAAATNTLFQTPLSHKLCDVVSGQPLFQQQQKIVCQKRCRCRSGKNPYYDEVFVSDSLFLPRGRSSRR